jgi:hypothetical protein
MITMSDIEFSEMKNNKVDVSFSIGDEPVIITIDCEIYRPKKSKQMQNCKGEVSEYIVKIGNAVYEPVEYGDDLFNLLVEKFRSSVVEGKLQEFASQITDAIIDWCNDPKIDIAYFDDCQDAHDFYEIF